MGLRFRGPVSPLPELVGITVVTVVTSLVTVTVSEELCSMVKRNQRRSLEPPYLTMSVLRILYQNQHVPICDEDDGYIRADIGFRHLRCYGDILLLG